MNDETSQLIQAVTDEFYGLHCDIGRLEQENARLRELIYDRAHEHAIQHMTEDELRITATNVLDENHKLRELVALWMVIDKHMSLCAITDCRQCPVREECEKSVYLEGLLGIDPKELSWRVQERMSESGKEVDV